MAGTLFVVATPIGNLEDITLRALRVLREANLIAAEDTRRTAKLLTSLRDTHANAQLSRAQQPRAAASADLRGSRRGERVALVTDAGTPGISDPGVGARRGVPERGSRSIRFRASAALVAPSGLDFH